jgi:hypothetical protein
MKVTSPLKLNFFKLGDYDDDVMIESSVSLAYITIISTKVESFKTLFLSFVLTRNNFIVTTELKEASIIMCLYHVIEMQFNPLLSL